MRRERTCRIRVRRIPREQRRLAPAAAEVDLSPVAALTRLRHPRRPPKLVERLRLMPDPLERLPPDVVEAHPRNLDRRLARQDVTHAVDRQKPLPPTVHARLPTVAVI